MEFDKWIHEYGSDDEIHNWEHDKEHDTGADADIGWDILQILTQAWIMDMLVSNAMYHDS